MEADKGRTTKGVFIRLSVQEYEWLLERAKGRNVVEYIREMINRSFEKSQTDILSQSDILSQTDIRSERIPLYNPAIHKAGDHVLVRRGKQLVETIVPELDADGHTIPSFR